MKASELDPYGSKTPDIGGALLAPTIYASPQLRMLGTG